MLPVLQTRRLTLTPVTVDDIGSFSALLWRPEVRRYFCDDRLIPREDVAAATAESCDPASITAYWRIERSDGDHCRVEINSGRLIGFAGIRPPSRDSLKLRAIGWRSLELIIALDPEHWGHGYARETVDAIAEEAGRDGVTFALVAAVDLPNERSHHLMHRCGFAELGRASGPAHEVVIYERAL